MPTLIFNDHKLNYYKRGKGKALVFLHGFGEDSSMWDEFTQAFSKNKIIRIDLLGFGKSEPVENVSIEYMADAVKAVLDELKIKSCILIGHSMGGYVSLAFAKKYESMLKGLGLFHSHPFADTEEKKDNRLKSIKFLEKNGHIHFVKQLVPKFFAPSFRSSNGFLINQMIHRASQYTTSGFIQATHAMINRHDQSDVLKNIQCPVLFIVGKKDELVPLQYSLDQTALPNVADILVLEDVGHAGMFEAKKECRKQIRNFIDLCNHHQKHNKQSAISA